MPVRLILIRWSYGWVSGSVAGQKLVGLAPAVQSGDWCGEIEVSWLVGWSALCRENESRAV